MYILADIAPTPAISHLLIRSKSRMITLRMIELDDAKSAIFDLDERLIQRKHDEVYGGGHCPVPEYEQIAKQVMTMKPGEFTRFFHLTIFFLSTEGISDHWCEIKRFWGYQKMKRLLFLIPVLAAVLISACGQGGKKKNPTETRLAEVSNLSAEAGDTTITLRWTDPSPSQFDHIQVTATPGDSAAVTVGKGIQTVTITDLSNDSIYSLTVKTVTSDGTLSSGLSINARPVRSENTLEVSALSATAGNGNIVLTWINPSDQSFAGIEIARNPGNGEVVLLNSYQTSYTATGLLNATEYEFHVRTLNTQGMRSAGISTTKTTLDTTVRTAELVNTPPLSSSQKNIDITVAGTGVTSYKYKLDNASWSSEFQVTHHITAENLSIGTHSLSVIGKSASGIWQPIAQATSYSWNIVSSAPTAILFNKPASVTNHDGMEILVGGSGVVSYQYSLDDEPWSDEIAIEATIKASDLAEGNHTIRVIAKDLYGSWQDTTSASSYTWAIDITPNAAEISNTPAILTNQQSVSITVSGAGVVSYRYRFDNETFSEEHPVTDTIARNDLTEGVHILQVVAKDAAGNWQEDTESSNFTWTIDTSANTAVLYGAPAPSTNVTSISIMIGGDGITSYRYALDSGIPSDFMSSSVPVTAINLIDGIHTLSVWGRDGAGNEQIAPTIFTWTIDTTPKYAVLYNKPANPTNQNSISIQVGGTGVTAYRYKLNNGSWSVSPVIVNIPITATGLPSGTHSLEVVGIDSIGNEQPVSSSTKYSWTVDTTVKSVVLGNLPAANTNNGSISITVGGTGITAYRFHYDSAAYGSEISVATPITECPPQGLHTLHVIGRDTAGNWSAEVTYTWNYDATPETATLVSAPPLYTNVSVQTLYVSGTNGVTAYRYSLDSQSVPTQVGSVATAIITPSLSEGLHTIKLWAIDAAGNVQTTPTVYSWTVDITPKTATFLQTPSNPSNGSSLFFAINSPMTAGKAPAIAFKFKLDNGSYSVEFPLSYHASYGTNTGTVWLNNLEDGNHTAYFIVKDAAGNWQTTPTTYTWLVDGTPPSAVLKRITWSPYSPECSIQVSGDGVVAYKWRINPSDPWSNELTNMQFMLPLGGAAGSTRHVYVIARDSCNNWQTTPTYLSWGN